jgi:hypothetical protein
VGVWPPNDIFATSGSCYAICSIESERELEFRWLFKSLVQIWGASFRQLVLFKILATRVSFSRLSEINLWLESVAQSRWSKLKDPSKVHDNNEDGQFEKEPRLLEQNVILINL